MLQVLGFASRKAAEEYMLANPETTLGAVHFNVDSSGINYVIQTNTTVRLPDLAVCRSAIAARGHSKPCKQPACLQLQSHTEHCSAN
jgi:hypothetical protein